MVVTHIFYFMLGQSSLLSTVISFVYKDKLWFDESMSVIFCIILKNNSFIPSPHNASLNSTLKLCYAIEEVVRRGLAE